MADLTFDLALIVIAAIATLAWYDERTTRIDMEKRLGKHRTSVLLNNAGSKSDLVERGG